jgi:uncharacterized protein
MRSGALDKSTSWPFTEDDWKALLGVSGESRSTVGSIGTWLTQEWNDKTDGVAMERRTSRDAVRMMDGDEDDGKKLRTIRGYAAKFNVPSEEMGGFVERIEPGAFSEALKDPNLDVRALFNHEPSRILGRTTAGTLRVGEDNVGLWYEIDPPDTQTGNEVVALIQRGDINQSSFGFTVLDDDRNIEDGVFTRVIKRVGKLFDVSPVTYPAYTQTTAEVRAWASAEQRQETGEDYGVRRRMLDLIELEEEL